MARLVRASTVALAALLVIALVAAWRVQPPPQLDAHQPPTRTLLDVKGRMISQIPPPDARARLPVALGEMGAWLPQITVALEDHRFRTHHGIDWHALAGAAWRNARHARIVSGGSTITQQLVKAATGRTSRSWLAKFYEPVAAWKLERRWGKDRILAEYLSRSHYGNRLIGPEAAARFYFSKAARDLTLAEAVFLAGLPQAPTRFNPWNHPAAARAKYLRSVATLAKRGVVSENQAQLLSMAPPGAGRFIPEKLAPHFTDMVVESRRERWLPAGALPEIQSEARERSGVSGELGNGARDGGVNAPAGSQRSLGRFLRTTLDLDLQRAAESLLRAHLRDLNRGDVTNGAVVILDNATGAVRAMVGSADYARSQINATLTPRSCGSTLKPFVYLEAVGRRIVTAATLLPDTPDATREVYTDYDPQNYNKRFRGPVRVREALASSLNVPAVVTLSRVGARRAFDALERWGFHFARTLDDYGAGFVLGNAEVRLLDLASAYAGLARGGVASPAVFLTGDPRRFDRVTSPEATAIITDILCDNEARQLSFGLNSPLDLGVRVASKTGTSSGFRDAWTAGFNRRHTVAVWVGNIDGRPMDEAAGIRAAAPLWAALMNRLLQNDEPLPGPLPGGRLVAKEIHTLTGETRRELFLAGTEGRDEVEFEDGHAVLPQEFAEWSRSPRNEIGAVVREDVPLAITQPRDGAVFVRDRALPASQQMIELSCNAPERASVRWFVNGVELRAGERGRVFWPLKRGRWEVTLKCGGQETRSLFAVR
jgi:penicillin-binding protein 1C